jgi:hypothetical protein
VAELAPPSTSNRHRQIGTKTLPLEAENSSGSRGNVLIPVFTCYLLLIT